MPSVLGAMTTAAILSTIILLWSVAVLCKLAGARSRGAPYQFSQWDGGLALRGRVLGRTGATAFAVFSIVLAVVAGYLLTRVGVAR